MKREYRMMAFVPRWGITPRLHNQMVDGHSFYVALYVDQLCTIFRVLPAHRADALSYALRHDTIEIWESDIPGPAKRSLISDDKLADYHMVFAKSMGAEYTDAVRDRLVHGHLGLRMPISTLVKVADLLDQVFYLRVEQLLGNQMVEQVYVRARQRLGKRLDTLSIHCQTPEQNTFVLQCTDFVKRTVDDELKRLMQEGALLPVIDEDKVDALASKA